MTTDSAENRKYISSTLDSFSIPSFYIRKDRHVVTGMEKPQDAKNTIRRINLQRNAVNNKYENIYDRFIRDKAFRKAMIEIGRTEQMIVEMDKLANEDHSYKPARKKSSSTVAIGGSTRIWHALIQYRQGMNPNLKSALSTMQRLKQAEDKKKQETMAQTSSSRLRGTGIQLVGV